MLRRVAPPVTISFLVASARQAVPPPCAPYACFRARSRNRSTFARLPHTAMLHQTPEWLRVWS